ncbi:hypothetical protein C2E23DRAFT_286010 [Lenzites betulinus]|nr:hypothetical protein C2E23DRAFT_286010 [Lenzites betulinus]
MLPPTPLQYLSRPYNPPVLIFASSQASATPLADEWNGYPQALACRPRRLLQASANRIPEKARLTRSQVVVDDVANV